jgi:hypothetical protein
MGDKELREMEGIETILARVVSCLEEVTIVEL